MIRFTWKGRHYHTENRWLTAVAAIPALLLMGLLAIILVGSVVAITGLALMALSSLIVTSIVVLAGQRLVGRWRRR